jgi:hypothetical protein
VLLKFKEDYVQVSSQRNRIPSFRPNGPVMRPDVSESSIQVHPSRRRGNTVWTPVSVQQVKGFPSLTQIWEDSCNRPDVILDKARHGEKLQPSGRRGNTFQTLVLIMKIANN